MSESGALKRFFDEAKDKDGKVAVVELLDTMAACGLDINLDPRLKDVKRALDRADRHLDWDSFHEVTSHAALLIEHGITGHFVVPDWAAFKKDMYELYDGQKSNLGGAKADYIPQLAKCDSNHWGVSVCTIDGQRLNIGDTDVGFCLQSSSKPLTYAFVQEELGVEKVHQHVGREPSGRAFNELVLNPKGRPHNPCINAGAIMCASLVQHEMNSADRYDHMAAQFSRLAGGAKFGFQNGTYQSEYATADRNFALSFFMKENGAFPEWIDNREKMEDSLRLYFQLCSMEINASDYSVVAATLANGGVCPVTGERVLEAETVKNTLSMMYSCGMYDYSGEFAFKIGLPAKSGVSGVVLVVIPDVMGIVTFSPNLDHIGNSERGVKFCTALTDKFNFHNYDPSSHVAAGKRDPTKLKSEAVQNPISALLYAAAENDVGAMKRLFLIGTDMESKDYDGRTALHLAASSGNLEPLNFLLKCGVDVNPKDRWGGTPLADAVREGKDNIAKILKDAGAKAE
jgi:glutaminase